jgi:hypothetical protein
MDVLLLSLRVLFAALLYAFLGVLAIVLWRDLRRAAGRREAPRPLAKLVVLPTDERILEAGTAFSLQPFTSIGRGPGNVISLPDTYASAHHALLAWRGNQWWLEDQGSRNGTTLNGTRLDRPTVVATGDIVGVGRTQFRLEAEDGSGAGG